MRYLVYCLLAVLITGCSLNTQTQNQHNVSIDRLLVEGKQSKQQQLKDMIKNDYETYQSINYKKLKSQNVSDQLIALDQKIATIVIDLVNELKGDSFEKPIVIRPVSYGQISNPVFVKNNSSMLIEGAFERQLSALGFIVFDDRQPKGKLQGDELILDIEVYTIGDDYFLNSKIKSLNSNKLLATEQNKINSYFLSEIVDGVEVYRPEKLGLVEND